MTTGTKRTTQVADWCWGEGALAPGASASRPGRAVQCSAPDRAARRGRGARSRCGGLRGQCRLLLILHGRTPVCTLPGCVQVLEEFKARAAAEDEARKAAIGGGEDDPRRLNFHRYGGGGVIWRRVVGCGRCMQAPPTPAAWAGALALAGRRRGVVGLEHVWHVCPSGTACRPPPTPHHLPHSGLPGLVGPGNGLRAARPHTALPPRSLLAASARGLTAECSRIIDSMIDAGLQPGARAIHVWAYSHIVVGDGRAARRVAAEAKQTVGERLGAGVG